MAVVSLSEFRSRRQSPVSSDQPPKSISLAEFESWLLAVRGIARSTAGTYCRIVKKIVAEFGQAPDHGELIRYVADLRERRSYHHTVNTIRAVEAYTAFVGNALTLGRPKKPEQDIGEVLTEAEVAVLIAAGCKDVRQKAIVSILAYSGIRNRELCNLLVEDIDFAANQIHVRQGKNSRNRRPDITAGCVRIIMEYLAKYSRKENEYLFTSLRSGRRLCPACVRKIVRQAAKRAGISKRVYPHIFRHSLAVNMLLRGADILAIQRQLGHKNVLTTIQTYLSRYQPDGQVHYLRHAPGYL